MSIENVLERIAAALEKLAESRNSPMTLELAPPTQHPAAQIRMPDHPQIPAPAPSTTPAPAPSEPKEITPEFVKKRFTALSTKGHRDALMKILADHGVNTLTALPPAKFPSVMTALNSLEAA